MGGLDLYVDVVFVVDSNEVWNRDRTALPVVLAYNSTELQHFKTTIYICIIYHDLYAFTRTGCLSSKNHDQPKKERKMILMCLVMCFVLRYNRSGARPWQRSKSTCAPRGHHTWNPRLWYVRHDDDLFHSTWNPGNTSSSCCTCQWVMPRTWMSHMAHIWMSHMSCSKGRGRGLFYRVGGR